MGGSEHPRTDAAPVAAPVAARRRSAAAPFGSRLLGTQAPEGSILRIRVRVLLTVSTVIANIAGTLCLVALLAWVVPLPSDVSYLTIAVNAVAVPLYLAFAVVVGVVWSTRALNASLRWATEGRPPNDEEQRLALRAPLRVVRIQAFLWAVAVVFFTTINGLIEPEMIAGVLISTTMVGAVVSAVTYLESEYLLRPVAARALAERVPLDLAVPGLSARNMLAWLLGSAVPVTGLMIIAGVGLVQDDVSVEQFGVAILVLGVITLSVGLLMTLIALRATLDPIRGLRRAIEAVSQGDLDAEVAVYDGTEMGLLQAGFNQMLSGLRERERIRDLFGRHVGRDVARVALDRSPALGGEVRDAAVLFVDIVGSTRLATELPPEDVVSLLNRFFAVVVEVVEAHGGMVNKFEGDAALAVFGAPVAVDDPAGRALACSRSLASRLAAVVPECRAGIGVAAGPVVAGNIGAEARFEYTVIGDAVNEASRLTEIAKHHPTGVVASASTLSAASAAEVVAWATDGEVTLRGRDAATAIATPR